MAKTKKSPKPITIDFETFGIEDRPRYPPVPVGVSIKRWGKKGRYYAWGHPTGNNCTWGEAREALAEAYREAIATGDGLLCQHGKFDLDVAEVHMDLPIPAWELCHDTLYLLFLDDPHQTELGLKPSANRLLNLPPDEQDAVAEWLLANQPVPGVKISKSRQSDHYYGKYLNYAPGDLVGKYADGDTFRTEAIFALLYPKTVEREMLVAYNRERQLQPILLDVERQGVPVDTARLAADIEMYGRVRDEVSAWVIKTIKAPPDINLNSGDQLVKAMMASGKVDPELLGHTASSTPDNPKYQTNKEALKNAVTDKVLAGALKYLTQLNTCLNTFMSRWLVMAQASDGLIFCSWNQTKSSEGSGAIGTRTGRLSSTPNFQNIPKEFDPIWAHEVADPKKAKLLPKCPFKNLPPLPQVRGYIVPFPGHVLIDRDYSQQEPRILAHFDGGDLMTKYLENPWIDFHDYAKEELANMGKFYERKPVKNTNLGLIYGMGVGKLAAKNDMTVIEAGELKKAILLLYPGLKDMYKDMKTRAGQGIPIRTWGGREYYCEEPRVVEGRLRHFDYKMVNILIQGSAADCTKEAIIRYYAAKPPGHKLLLNVHDQITCSVPKKEIHPGMAILKQSMESVEFDVPILSEGDWSEVSWNKLVKYDQKGKVVYADPSK